MFGTGKKLEYLEKEVRITLRQKDREIERLRQEVDDVRSWGKKWRQKAKYLRLVRRKLTDKLKFYEDQTS